MHSRGRSRRKLAETLRHLLRSSGAPLLTLYETLRLWTLGSCPLFAAFYPDRNLSRSTATAGIAKTAQTIRSSRTTRAHKPTSRLYHN